MSYPQNLSTGDLQQKCKVIRRHIVNMLTEAGSGHPGGSLSAVEILTALFFNVMRHRPQEPKWRDRDLFVMSKGHGAPALYSVMAECGYFSTDLLPTLRKMGSPLQGHPDKRMLPYLEACTGSLGQGLSISLGHALAFRMDKTRAHAYVLLGDGECEEGQVWEAAMAAAYYKVDTLVAVVDFNKIQNDDWSKNIMSLEPFVEKWKAFGWSLQEIDGHDMSAVLEALNKAKGRFGEGKPNVIVAHTVKGKGVSFMENQPKYHGLAPTKEEREKALAELA